MSCYIVSATHISAIVQFACRHNMKVGWLGGSRGYAYKPGMEQEAVDILYAANVKSVNQRYREKTPTDGCVYNPGVSALEPIEVIKAVHGLRYQCDEWSEFEGSDAARILRDIEQNAIQLLPGYDVAEWEILDPVTEE